MRKIALTVAAILSLVACKNETKESITSKEIAMETTMTTYNIAEEKTNIQELARTLFKETDNRNWTAVKQTMADSVYTDYTALGGEAGFKTPDEIVGGWQQLLPGFERTIHHMDNFSIWVAGNRATATMDAVATHYLDSNGNENFWTVIVGYDMEFIKENGSWKIARVDLSLYDQLGNNNLPTQAMEVVKNNDIKPIKKTLEKVTGFEKHNPAVLLANWKGFAPNSYSVHKAGASTDSGVTLQEVTFNSNGVNLIGHLFLPPNFDASQKYPTAIVTGSWTSVKEQMPDEYASVMAKDGFITLTFDFTGFGESEGQPRFVEDYNLKIADIKAAVDFLAAHPNVDAENLSGLGVCASSGYMAHATAQDDRIKKLILVAPWLHNAEIARNIYDMRPGGTDGLLTSAKAAKEKYAETGEMDYVLAASELDPLSAMYVPHGAFDYYLNPAKAAGAHYDNLFAVSSWEPWLTFDGIGAGKEISQPVFIVHSESGAVPQGAKEFYGHLQGQKDIVWLNEYNQQQLYFEEKAVNAAMSEVINYLK